MGSSSNVTSQDSFSELVASLSHDLRGPLHAILGTGELLLDELGSSANGETWRTDLQGICSSGRRLADLLELMLEIARIESGRAPITQAEVDVASIVEGLVRDLRQKGARIAVELEGRRGPVFLDGKRFRLALLSLLRLLLAAAPHAPAKVVITYDAEGALIHVDVDTNRECALALGLGQKEGAYAHRDAALSLVLALNARMSLAMDILPKDEGAWQFSWRIPRAVVKGEQGT